MMGGEQNSTDENKEAKDLCENGVATGEMWIANMRAHWNTVEVS